MNLTCNWPHEFKKAPWPENAYAAAMVYNFVRSPAISRVEAPSAFWLSGSAICCQPQIRGFSTGRHPGALIHTYFRKLHEPINVIFAQVLFHYSAYVCPSFHYSVHEIDGILTRTCALSCAHPRDTDSLVESERVAELCALALSRCSPSQIGRLLESWSSYDATRFLAASVTSSVSDEGGSVVVGDAWAHPDSRTCSSRDVEVDPGDEGKLLASSSATAGPAAGENGTAGVGTGDGTDCLVRALVSDDGVNTPSLEDTARIIEQILNADGDGEETTPSAALHSNEPAGPPAVSRFTGGLSRRAAEGTLRLLLVREMRMATAISIVRPDLSAVPQTAETGALEALSTTRVDEAPDVGSLVDRLCLRLAQLELRSAAQPRPQDWSSWRSATGEEAARDASADTSVGVLMDAGEEFGVGSVECGVGYALAVADGRVALQTLRALLEEAESSVKALRESGEENAGVDEKGDENLVYEVRGFRREI